MAKRLIGLDIGSKTIKVLHLENSEVLKTHEVPYSEEALGSLAQEGFLKGDFLVTGLSGVDAQVRSLDVPFSSAKKIEAILGGLLDAQLPLEIEELILSWCLQTEKSDEQQQIMAAFAKKSSVKAFLDSLKTYGANPNILTLKSAALYELLKYQLRELKTAMIIDIGASSTSMCVGNNQRLLMARSILKSDLNSVMHELRQTMISFGKPIEQIYLVGGGALTPGVEETFGSVLGIPTQVLRPFSLSPTMALAVSYALLGQARQEKKNHFNLRRGEFAFKSEMKLVTGHSRTLSIWAAIVLLLMVVNYGTRRYFLGSRIDQLVEHEQALCKEIMGQEKAPKSKKKISCLGTIKKAIAQDKQDQIPKMSAADYYLEVSKDLGRDLSIKVTDLDIGNNGVRIGGDVVDFEQVDAVVAAFSKSRCFKNIEKGPARQSKLGVSFQVSMDIDCGVSQ